MGGGSKPCLSTRKPHCFPQPRGTGMQGIKGTLHNRGKNNKPQPRQRNENHVPWPLGRAPSSGTCFKELLFQSSGLNFLHMPSCWRGRRNRGGVEQWGEFGSTRAGWHRSSSGCHSISRWFWWPGGIFGRGLGDPREFFKVFPIVWMIFPTPELRCCPSLSARPI